MEGNTTAKQRSFAPLYIISAVLALAVIASVALSVLMMSKVNNLAQINSEMYEIIHSSYDTGEDTPTTENDVVIAGSYKIISTENISDAYKSGDYSSLSDTDKSTLESAKAVIEEVITDGMTDFEKEKAIYNWICDNISMDGSGTVLIQTTPETVSTPGGVLKTKQAVCVGFATTFRLFMQMLDIPCMVVHNTDEYHSWNAVQIDGDWYYTDIYSDINSGRYSHFNLNTSMMIETGHDWDYDFFPVGNSVKYNVLYMDAIEKTDPLELPAAIRSGIDEGLSVISFKFPADISDHDSQMLGYVLTSVDDAVMNSSLNLTIFYSTYALDDCCLISVGIYRYGEEDYDWLTDDDYVNISESVSDAFSDVYYADEWYDGDDWYVNDDFTVAE